MTEDEIIEIVKNEIINTYAERKAIAFQGLLDLYQKEKEKNKESNKENTIINRRLENVENNYTQLIEDVSTLAIALELQEDATIDEMYEEIKNLQEECKETDLEAQKYFEKYEDEKEKNKIKDIVIKNYQVIATNPEDYIHKDKIREILEKYDKDIAWDSADDHYYFTKFIQKLLEESNAE